MKGFARTAIVILITCSALPGMAHAQARGQRGGRGQAPKPPSAPTPRFADGSVNLGAAPGMKGFWNVFSGNLIGKGGSNLATNLTEDEIPFQPWARALYKYRVSTNGKDDPHTRCIPDGGVHFFQLTNGLEIIQQPELNRIIIVAGHNHIWKVIHMEPGRVILRRMSSRTVISAIDRPLGRRNAGDRQRRLQRKILVPPEWLAAYLRDAPGRAHQSSRLQHAEV